MSDMAIIAFLPTEGAPNGLATARTAGAIARTVGSTSVALLPAGSVYEDVASSGVDRVVRIEGLKTGGLDGPATAAAFVAAIEAAELAVGPAVVLLPFGGAEEEAAAAITVALNGTAMGKCSAIELTNQGCTVERPVYGGRATVQLHADRGPFICIVRPSLVIGSNGSEREAVVQTVTVDVASDAPALERIVRVGSRRPPLENATIIVSGGRGMVSVEGFAILERLASAIDGVVACSLPAADAGWYPVSHQIGQSGKFVSPDLYIAVGVSGTSQHMAGIAESASIFAINNDPDSSIWQIAEVGVKDDWRTILPPLIEALSA